MGPNIPPPNFGGLAPQLAHQAQPPQPQASNQVVPQMGAMPHISHPGTGPHLSTPPSKGGPVQQPATGERAAAEQWKDVRDVRDGAIASNGHERDDRKISIQTGRGRDDSRGRSPKKEKSRKRRRRRSRSSDRDKEPEEFYVRGRKKSFINRRPKYWDMSPEEALKLGLPMTRTVELPIKREAGGKIYCGFGALTFNPSEEELKQFFNVTMVAAQGEDRVPGESVTRVFLDLQRRYGFIHFRTQEEAEQALELDGIMFRGQRLKLGRAISNDMTSAPAAIQSAAASPGLKKLDTSRLNIIKTHVPDGPNKLYIGGLPPTLNDDQVKELLQTYGPLRSFFMFKDYNTGLSRGYAFAEYRNPGVTKSAIKGLNGIKIGDRNIQVSLHDPALSGQMQAPPNLTELGLNAVPVSGQAKVLCLLQMVTEEDLGDNSEYGEICQDIRDECGNYGAVRDLVIPRTGPGVGKVFVAFNEQNAANQAKAALEGRQFMGRTVLVTYYDEDKFNNRAF